MEENDKKINRGVKNPRSKQFIDLTLILNLVDLVSLNRTLDRGASRSRLMLRAYATLTSRVILEIRQVVGLLKERGGCTAAHRGWKVIVAEYQAWRAMAHHRPVVLRDGTPPDRFVLPPRRETYSRVQTYVPPYRGTATLEQITGWAGWKPDVSTSTRRTKG